MIDSTATRSCAGDPPRDTATSAGRLRVFDFDGLRLLEARHAPGRRIGAHAHERATLLVSLGPEFEERIEGRSLAVQRFDVVWKPGGVTHVNRYPDGARSFVVEFSQAFWTDRDETLRPEPWTGRGLPAATLLGLHHRVFSSSERLGVELDELLTCALDQMRSTDVDAAPAPERMARVRDRLRASFAAPPRLAELAADVELHPSHLCRLFRRQFGSSMSEYVRRVRIRHALDLLRARPHPPLAGIAFALGYADQAHFTRDFRRLVGVPPGRYRSTVLGAGCKDLSRQHA